MRKLDVTGQVDCKSKNLKNFYKKKRKFYKKKEKRMVYLPVRV